MGWKKTKKNSSDEVSLLYVFTHRGRHLQDSKKVTANVDQIVTSPPTHFLFCRLFQKNTANITLERINSWGGIFHKKKKKTFRKHSTSDTLFYVFFTHQGRHIQRCRREGQREGATASVRVAGWTGDRLFRHDEDGRTDEPASRGLHEGWRPGHTQRQCLLAVGGVVVTFVLFLLGRVQICMVPGININIDAHIYFHRFVHYRYQ